MQGKKEPEYRFHTKDGVYWVKLSTLQQLEKLPLDQKNEKYFHWLNKIRDSGELAFIAKFQNLIQFFQHWVSTDWVSTKACLDTKANANIVFTG